MIVKSLKEFAAENNFKTVAPTVRENSNGYPFVTFINTENVAENVYFSKAAEKYKAGTPVTSEMLKTLQIGVVRNEAGETRTKLISNSERLELAELL